MQRATKCPQESHTQLLSSDIGFRMKPTEVGADERLSVLLSESNVYLSACRLFRVPILSSLPPHLRAKAQKRRGEERRIKLAVSREVCLFGDILALQFRLLSNSWLFFLSIPSAGITGMTHHTWEVRNFIGCPVCHSEHEKRGQNRA